MRASRHGVHISGAEGLYEAEDILQAVRQYTERALTHPRGIPDSITLSIDVLTQKPKKISSLPLCTLKCASPSEAKAFSAELLCAIGVSSVAVKKAFKVIQAGNMRGAALMSAQTGKRFEPDRTRGVRASRMGIEKTALRILNQRLSRLGINTPTVKEALILASKVASCKSIIAELCVSDDPDYTTGYVASKNFGYVRVPNIKTKGSTSGGRVFFIKDTDNIDGIIEYLQARPVIIAQVSKLSGLKSLNEIVHDHQGKMHRDFVR